VTGALEHLPGEYVLLEDRERRMPPRSFSIANAPRPDGLISLLVTRVPDGETSTWVHERLRAGEEVGVSGPHRTFVDDPTSTGPALFLAAESGLAPIRSLLEAAVAANTRPPCLTGKAVASPAAQTASTSGTLPCRSVGMKPRALAGSPGSPGPIARGSATTRSASSVLSPG
jgi:hypothetical protein